MSLTNHGRDSSMLLRKLNSRILYTSYIGENNRFQGGCSSSIQIENGGSGESKQITQINQGSQYTTREELTAVLASSTCPTINNTPIPPVPTTVGGSALFSASFGSDGSYLQYENGGDFAINGAAFTIEWFQYFTGGQFPRPFSIGSYDDGNISIAVSYEGVFYLWVDGSPTELNGEDPPQNVWTHVAIVGDGLNEIKVYLDGISIETVSGSYTINNSSSPLTIGNESSPSVVAAFGGNITNFRFVKGTAIYTADFTPPTAPLTNVSGTELLLLTESETELAIDSSDNNKTPTNTGVVFNSESPF